MLQQNGAPGRPHGVASGGTVIEMLECLSTTTRTSDYKLILWLQTHYIDPFGRIERLDGLVVTESKDMCVSSSFHLPDTTEPCTNPTISSEDLDLAYERYIEVQGSRTRAQKLWVPGLEPTYRTYTSDVESIPALPRHTEYKKWRASDMYYNDGIEVKRKGKFECNWTDERKWDRTIWSVVDKKSVMEKEEGLEKRVGEIGCRNMGSKKASFLLTSRMVPQAKTANSKTLSRAPTKLSQSQTPDEASSVPQSEL
jgi:hypothetical protein